MKTLKSHTYQELEYSLGPHIARIYPEEDLDEAIRMPVRVQELTEYQERKRSLGLDRVARSFPVNLSRDDLIFTRVRGGIKASGRRPAEKHLRASIRHIVGSVVIGMDTTRVDILPTEPGGSFVEDLLV